MDELLKVSAGVDTNDWRDDPLESVSSRRLASLRALERKVLWLSTWMIHNANHLRPKRDTLKVGGHQASCASSVTLKTGLHFDALRPQDRVAVKPHAALSFTPSNACWAGKAKR